MAVKSHDPKDYGDPLLYDPDFNGPLKRRSCTDIICLLLLLVFIGCWIGIGLYAFIQGDINHLLVPKDSQGALCGVDKHVKNKPYLFFFDLTKCLQPIPFSGCRTTQVCVEKCPQTVFLLDSVGYNNFYPNDMICVNDIKPRNKNEAVQLVSEGKCAQWYLPSESVFNRCLYNIADRRLLNFELGKIQGDEIKLMQNYLTTARSWLSLIVQNGIGIFTNRDEHYQVGNNVVNDIVNSWKEMLVGLVLAVVVCIIFILLMRWIAGFMVWLSILGVLAVLSFCMYICIKNYKYYLNNKVVQESTEWYQQLLEKKGTWLSFTIIVAVALCIIVLMLIFLRKRIVLAIALIKEASRAVSSVTTSLFFPLFPWCLQIGVIVYAVFVGLYLSTVSPNNPNRQPCVGSNCPTEGGSLTIYLHVFNVFGFFWIMFFISGLADMVLASTFATWYWTFHKRNVPFFTVTEATARTLRFHMGTLAFGSLILAICAMIRVILEYIDSKLKKYDNILTKAIMCCCKCFFWCLESFIKFINRNAYIMCAIHGKNFCASAKDAFNLLMRNVIRVFVLDKVTDFLLFLSKILVTGVVTCIAYAVFATDFVKFIDQSRLHYNYVPVIIIGVCTFFITLVFFSVFTMAVDTLFLCFLEDYERNDGSAEKPYYMSKNLMKILGKKNK
ncbi:hypothetical protein FQA39_LY01499 [Lamprigera yunnana]|nr:hypothetical protein FQA39_LY01499 [Lamprigera yunnana]